jgi:hypothetical protein
MRPDYILPCDLVLLSQAKKIIVHYFRIKHNLHLFYNHDLIDGFEKYVFKDITQLVKRFSSVQRVWVSVNAFRKNKGYAILPRSKFRLVEYNEAVFSKPVGIKPIALFGYKKKARILAKRYNLKYYRSAKDFFNTLT